MSSQSIHHTAWHAVLKFMNDFIKKHFQPDRSALMLEFHSLLASQMDVWGLRNRIFQRLLMAPGVRSRCVLALRRYYSCLNECFKSLNVFWFQLFWPVFQQNPPKQSLYSKLMQQLIFYATGKEGWHLCLQTTFWFRLWNNTCHLPAVEPWKGGRFSRSVHHLSADLVDSHTLAPDWLEPNLLGGATHRCRKRKYNNALRHRSKIMALCQLYVSKTVRGRSEPILFPHVQNKPQKLHPFPATPPPPCPPFPS